MSINLIDLLTYRNNNVLNRYKKDYPNNKLSAEQAFEELMKFFWLNIQHEVDKKEFPHKKDLDFIVGIHSEMKEIDDMWHTFLLFTKDYISFCKKYIGKYFHHTPSVDSKKITKEEFKIDFSRFLSYVYDHLKKETVEKWFGPLLIEET